MATSKTKKSVVPQFTGLSTESLDLAESFAFMTESVRIAREGVQDSGTAVPSNGEVATLTFLAKILAAKSVVVVGTGPGITSLALFAGMDDNGVLTGIDIDSDWLNEARIAFKVAGIGQHRYRLIAGQPLNVMQKLRDAAYDIVLINGDKLEYVEFVVQATRLLRPGGLLLLSDVLFHNLVADPRSEDDAAYIIREAIQLMQTDDDFTSIIIPLGDGLLAAIKD